jgi:hypothetical protein
MSGSNAKSIAEIGWRQGSILPMIIVNMLKENSVAGLPEDIKDLDLLIVVSHDCDIANSSFEAEPYAEIILARYLPVDKKNGQFFWGRHPRIFQFLTQSKELLYEISIHNKFSISRNLLLDSEPDTQRNIPKEIAKQICYWISKRYIRASFPDSFNNRISKAQKAIGDKLKKGNEAITAIYISTSDDELKDDEVYKILIRVTMQCKAYENLDLVTNCQNIVDFIELKLSECQGIDVLDSSLVSEAELSIDDLHFFKRWDYDYLSHSTDMPDEIAPYP